jgi:hypothetical protein
VSPSTTSSASSTTGRCTWTGGATLTGAPAPRALLYVPAALPGTVNLGRMGASPGFVLGDVTGDGVTDILAVSALHATARGVHVWAGGATLNGQLFSTTRLVPVDPNSVGGAGLGASGTALHLADVTGDGTLDVVLGFSDAQVANVASVGTVSVWAGGSGLLTAPPPLATLRNPTFTLNDRFGTASGDGIVLGDVTGDGVTDVLGLGRAIDRASSSTRAPSTCSPAGRSSWARRCRRPPSPCPAPSEATSWAATDPGTGGRGARMCPRGMRPYMKFGVCRSESVRACSGVSPAWTRRFTRFSPIVWRSSRNASWPRRIAEGSVPRAASTVNASWSGCGTPPASCMLAARRRTAASSRP